MIINRRSVGFLLIILSIFLIIIFSFVKSDIDERDSQLCSFYHSNPDLDVNQCPAHSSNTSWYVVISFGIAFLILASGIYLVTTKILDKSEPKKIDKSKLDNEELKIYNLLEENEGAIYQSDLIKELSLSKVKVTRILDKMEAKKILERKRRGMTNIIILK